MSITIDDYSSLLMDPVIAQMMTGEIQWGDICMDLVPEVASAVAAEELPHEMPEGWDQEYPELRLRKDIWENFPVTVNPLGAGADGAERHAIAWHRRNFEEWRNTRTADGYDAMDYENVTLFRLFKCLEASKYWTVEDPIADSQICVIRMNFVPKTEVEAAAPASAPAADAEAEESDDETAFLTAFGKTKPVAKPAPAAAHRPALPAVPLFTRLNDIKEHFPVVWHKVEEAQTRTAVYALEIFGKKIVEMSRASGKNTDAVRADVETRLMAALRASPAWRVLRSEGREFCRLEMA